MKSPPGELALITAGPVLVNLLRSIGEADGDTFSEWLRDKVDRAPYGRQLLASALAGAGVIFYRHIVKPLD